MLGVLFTQGVHLKLSATDTATKRHRHVFNGAIAVNSINSLQLGELMQRHEATNWVFPCLHIEQGGKSMMTQARGPV